jgi:hypothetical protein
MAKNKYIETPQRMWELFCEYRTEVKANPKHKNDFAGKDADEVIKKLERPLTMEGFQNYCEDQDIISNLSQYFANTEERYTKYQSICSRVKRAIRQDQIEGGMVGIFNPSITQRLNNLVEKIQEDGTKQITIKVVRGNRNQIEQSTSGAITGIEGGEEI